MKREYANDRITVLWDSSKCIHSGICDAQLPQVFNPGKRPWINLAGADVEMIKHAIDNCPSGALSYKIANEDGANKVTIKAIKNGPYKITGRCHLINTEGQVLDGGDTFALCRCGASKNMPFCDGAHYRKSQPK